MPTVSAITESRVFHALDKYFLRKHRVHGVFPSGTLPVSTEDILKDPAIAARTFLENCLYRSPKGTTVIPNLGKYTQYGNHVMITAPEHERYGEDTVLKPCFSDFTEVQGRDVLLQLSRFFEYAKDLLPFSTLHGSGDASVNYRGKIRFAQSIPETHFQCITMPREERQETELIELESVPNSVKDLILGSSYAEKWADCLKVRLTSEKTLEGLRLKDELYSLIESTQSGLVIKLKEPLESFFKRKNAFEEFMRPLLAGAKTLLREMNMILYPEFNPLEIDRFYNGISGGYNEDFFQQVQNSSRINGLESIQQTSPYNADKDHKCNPEQNFWLNKIQQEPELKALLETALEIDPKEFIIGSTYILTAHNNERTGNGELRLITNFKIGPGAGFEAFTGLVLERPHDEESPKVIEQRIKENDERLAKLTEFYGQFNGNSIVSSSFKTFSQKVKNLIRNLQVA